VYAGGGGYGDAYYGYSSVLSDLSELPRESKIRTILSDNIETISANTLREDLEYNGTHFYTKKLDLAVTIPNDLLIKIKKAYIAFNPMPDFYIYDMAGASSKDLLSENYISQIDIDVNNIPQEITLERKDFDPYISNDYGSSFMGTLFLELTDGTVIPFANPYNIYFNANTTEGKLSQLSNMYYTLHPDAGYPDLTNILQKYFDKLEARTGSVSAYITALEKIQTKVVDMTTEYDEAQKKLAENLNSEEDFQAQADSYGKIMQRFNILSDLKWRIGTEIQTRNSEGILEEIFSDYQ